MHHMLHSEANNGDSNPAACAEQKWFSAGFDQLYNITVQSNRSHCHNDKELGEFFQWRKHIGTDSEIHAYGGDNGGNNKIQDEHRKCFF